MNPQPRPVRRYLLSIPFAAALALPCAALHAASLAQVEAEYLVVRELRDRIDVTLGRGAQTTPDGQRLQDLLDRYAARRGTLSSMLGDVEDAATLAAEDARALALMRAAL